MLAVLKASPLAKVITLCSAIFTAEPMTDLKAQQIIIVPIQIESPLLTAPKASDLAAGPSLDQLNHWMERLRPPDASCGTPCVVPYKHNGIIRGTEDEACYIDAAYVEREDESRSVVLAMGTQRPDIVNGRVHFSAGSTYYQTIVGFRAELTQEEASPRPWLLATPLVQSSVQLSRSTVILSSRPTTTPDAGMPDNLNTIQIEFDIKGSLVEGRGFKAGDRRPFICDIAPTY